MRTAICWWYVSEPSPPGRTTECLDGSDAHMHGYVHVCGGGGRSKWASFPREWSFGSGLTGMRSPPQAVALWRCYLLQWILCLRCHGYLQARCSNPSQDQRTVILSLGPVSIPSTVHTKAFLLLLLAPMGATAWFSLSLQSLPNESRDD
jgi:hypothetical protein